MPENKEKYISLMDATKLCNYSQEYLSLRARRGKLKAVKNGRNWFTTKEWLDQYIVKTEKYKEELILKNNQKETFFKIKTVPFAIERKIDIFPKVENAVPVISRDFKEVLPPENLPIENINFSEIRKHDRIISVLKVGFSLGMIFGVLVSAIVFNKLFLGNFINATYEYFSGFPSGIAYAGKVFRDYFSWLGNSDIYMVSAKNVYGLGDVLRVTINYIIN